MNTKLKYAFFLWFVGASLCWAQVDFSTVINVTQSPYNIQANNNVDQTAAIQAVVDAASADAQGAGVTLYFPAGEYRIDGSVSFHGDARRGHYRLEGDGQHMTTFYSPDSDRSDAMIYARRSSSFDGFQLAHLGFEARSTTFGNAINGIAVEIRYQTRYSGETRLLVDDVRFSNEPAAYPALFTNALKLTNARGVRISNSSFMGGYLDDSSNDYYAIRSTAGASDAEVVNTIVYRYRYGIRFENDEDADADHRVSIRNCRVTYCAYPVSFKGPKSSETEHMQKISVIGNVLEARSSLPNGGVCLDMSKVDFAIVEGNSMSCGKGMRLLDENDLQSLYNYHIFLEGEFGRISGNAFDGNGESGGVCIHTGSYHAIVNNTFSGVVGSEVWLFSSVSDSKVIANVAHNSLTAAFQPKAIHIFDQGTNNEHADRYNK